MSANPLDWLVGFLVESLCYVAFIGPVYVIAFLIGCPVAALFAPRTWERYFRRVQKLGLFLVVLLIVGDLFGFVWGVTIWGRFYRSTDYCGTDFLPFLSVRQVVIDAPFGDEPHGLMGVTLFQLNLIWFPFAVATWAVTVLVYRWMRRRLKSPIEVIGPEPALTRGASV